MTVWAVLKIAEDGDQVIHVYATAREAGEAAAEWLSQSDNDPDGYVCDMVNAADDGDSAPFISNDDLWSVQIFRDEMEVMQ